MRIRFVRHSDLASGLICDREGEVAPFVPSHVEIVVQNPDGSLGYLGALDDREGGAAPGVQIRPAGYDKATMLHELFVDVALPDEAAAEKFARSKIGEPYDWEAIVDYLLPLALHETRHLICSAFVTLALKAGGEFVFPLAAAPHATSPRDVLFWLSGRMAIQG